MVDDMLVNKSATIERCVQRVRDEYAGDARNLYDDITRQDITRQDITRQDAMILNIQRACQAAIDLAMHVVRLHDLGPPQESRDAFALLTEAGLLDDELGDRLMRMVGFCNIAIHEYQKLNLDVVKAIIGEHLTDFTRFAERALTTDAFRQQD
ncbi:MAG: DUF86 domain-containing protein [Bacteroidetes bacterium]|jgi:uncharacterized protein YutE (UPF0331/DUF86 family)|nr:DUF86 domain-containing protein [Bacteroidota bacterium]